MADWTKQEIFDIITEYLERYGSAVGSDAVRELTPEELTDETLEALTIPSVMPTTEKWVCTSLRNMLKPITDSVDGLEELKDETEDARDAANAAAGSVDQAISDAEAATAGAENVNAAISGMTVTITNRSGQSSSVNIGFEIDPSHVYASKAAMIADAANVLAGQFCMIATTDPTATDNATLWSRNSQPASAGAQAYTFLSDLDQASSAAWADWLDNMKPAIQQATTDASSAATSANSAATSANTAASLANEKATAANSAATLANTNAGYAETQGDYAKQQGDYAKSWNDHPPYIGNGTNGDLNYWYVWVNATYIRSVYAKGDDLDWSTMTEQEKDDLAARVLAQLTFASVQTCEDIIDELT